MVKSKEKIIDEHCDRENNSYYPPDEALLSTKSLTLPRCVMKLPKKEEIYQFHDQTEKATHQLKRSNTIHMKHQSEIQSNKTQSGYSHSLPRHVRTADWITHQRSAPAQVPHIGHI